jgi:hypothetical protein
MAVLCVLCAFFFEGFPLRTLRFKILDWKSTPYREGRQGQGKDREERKGKHSKFVPKSRILANITSSVQLGIPGRQEQ